MRLGQEAHRLATAGQGSPRSGLKALEWAAWRQRSPVVTGGRGGPWSGVSGAQGQGMGDRGALEWVGEWSRRWNSVFNRALHTRFFPDCVPQGFVQPCPGPCGLLSQGMEGGLHCPVVCGRTAGLVAWGGERWGPCCFSFHRLGDKQLGVVRLLVWEWWSLRSLLLR